MCVQTKNINECNLSNICGDNSICIDSDGSFERACIEGYANANSGCLAMNTYQLHVTSMHLVPMVEAILTVNVMLDLLVMVSHVKTSMNVIPSILAILMPFAAIILVRTLVNVKRVLMVAVLLVMILTSVIKILAIKMPTAPI